MSCDDALTVLRALDAQGLDCDVFGRNGEYEVRAHIEGLTPDAVSKAVSETESSLFSDDVGIRFSDGYLKFS